MSIRHQTKLLTLLAIASMFFAACSGLSPQATATPEPETVDDVQPVVNATGKVVPAQFSRLSITVPGVVQEILVEEGDQVEKDQVLARLRGKEDLLAAIEAARFEVTSSQKALDDLSKNVNETRTAALNEIAAATKAMRDAQYQLDNFTVPQTQAKYSTTEALEVMQGRLDQARIAFEPYKYYPESNDTREDLKEALDEAQADYNSAVKRLQYETELEVAKVRLAEAIKDYETWKEGPDPDEVTVAQARLDNAKTALAAAEAQLEDLELRAPFAGTVSDLDVRIGEWVIPGQPIIQLADLTGLQVETTDLNEIDAARVNVDDPVLVTFDALPGVEVHGTVRSISPKSSEGSGVNYTVVIDLEELPELLRWGMTAFADIQVE